jgi:flagellar capping protein FliD
VTEAQYLAAALTTVPTMIVVLIGILINNSQLSDLNNTLNNRIGDVNNRIDDVNRRISELDRKIDQRFDDMKETWRSELHRVEEVLDARLKHLEDR